MDQPNISHLKKNVAPFEKTDTKASIRQLINTLVPLLAALVCCLSKSFRFLLAYTSDCGRCFRIYDPDFYHVS